MSLKANDSNSETAGIEHIDALFGYAMVLSRNDRDAEDLVQETYVRALGAIKRLRSGSNVKGWMFTILRNVWLNQLRRRRRCPISDVPVDESASDVVGKSDGPYSLLVSKVERQQVQDAIQKLPIDCREIIFLREYEGLSYREIATVLDCPAGTVMSRLAKARSKLRAILLTSVFTSSSCARTDSG
jgi:RNA polymerase sigma-70 factor, ECF subfamily